MKISSLQQPGANGRNAQEILTFFKVTTPPVHPKIDIRTITQAPGRSIKLTVNGGEWGRPGITMRETILENLH